MKDKLIEQFREVTKDRNLTVLLAGIVIVTLSLIVYISIGLTYRDTPVVTHYTSYGTQHLYDSSWYEMLSFIGFALVVLVGHIVLTVKLSVSKNRSVAFVFGFASIVVLIVAFIVVRQVLRVAAL